MPYCPNCGEEIESSQSYCNNCGHELDDSNKKEKDIDRTPRNKDTSSKEGNSYLSNRVLGVLLIVLVMVAVGSSNLLGPSEQDMKDKLSESVDVKDVTWEYVGLANQNGDPYGNVQAKVTNSYDEPVTLTYRYEKLYDSDSELYRDVTVTLDRWETKTLNMTADGKEIDLTVETDEVSVEKKIEVGQPSIGGIEWELDGDGKVSGIEDPHFIHTKMKNKGPEKIYVRLSGEDSAEGDAVDRSSRVGVQASPGIWTEEGYQYRKSSLTLEPYETQEIPIKIEWTAYGTTYPSQTVDLDFRYSYHKFEGNSEFSFDVTPSQSDR